MIMHCIMDQKLFLYFFNFPQGVWVFYWAGDWQTYQSNIYSPLGYKNDTFAELCDIREIALKYCSKVIYIVITYDMIKVKILSYKIYIFCIGHLYM